MNLLLIVMKMIYAFSILYIKKNKIKCLFTIDSETTGWISPKLGLDPWNVKLILVNHEDHERSKIRLKKPFFM